MLFTALPLSSLSLSELWIFLLCRWEGWMCLYHQATATATLGVTTATATATFGLVLFRSATLFEEVSGLLAAVCLAVTRLVI